MEGGREKGEALPDSRPDCGRGCRCSRIGDADEPAYTTLFTGLNQTELNEIVSYLSEQGMADYRIEGSDTILVPAEQEVRLKAALAQQGYPKSGFATPCIWIMWGA